MTKHRVIKAKDYSFYMTIHNWGIYCVAWTVLNHSNEQSLESVNHLYNIALQNGIIF